MPPSRRQILRSGALSLSVLGGCSMTDEPETERLGSPETPSATATTEEPPLSPCGPGPLPDSGWPLPDASPGRTNYAPDATGPTAKPTAEWSVRTPSSNFGPLPEFTRPIVADGQVYVGQQIRVGTMKKPPDEQYVYAHDAETGEREWRGAMSFEAPSTPLLTDDLVLVPEATTEGRTLYAFDAASGEQQWANSTRIDHVLPTPDGVFVTEGDVIRSLDADGRLDEYVTIPGEDKWVERLAWADDTLYAIVREDQSYALTAIDTAEKAIARSEPIASEEDVHEVVATPCAVFVATDTALQAMKRDGTQAWSVDANIHGMATDSERIYAVDEPGRLRCIAVADGKQRWKRLPDGGTDEWRGFDGTPVIAGETVYAGTSDGALVALSADDGSERWRLDTEWLGTTELSLADDTLYTVGRKDDEDYLIAFR